MDTENRIKQLSDKVSQQSQLIYDMAKLLWIFEEYGYIGNMLEDDERDQCDYWRGMARDLVAEARKDIQEKI